MKRFFALVALVLGLASCQTEPEGLDVQMGGAVDATITVNIPDSETRAGGSNSAGSAFHNGIIASADYTVRYILQVFNEDGTASKDMMYKYSDDDTVAFDVHLVPGRDYRFVVWADIVNADGVQDGVKCADLHYEIGETLQDITLAVPVDGNDKWAAMDETRDAYTGIYDSIEFSAAENITLTLKRPFAKLRVITTDMNELFDDVIPHNAVVTYTTPHYDAFNAFSGVASGERTGETHTYTIADYADQTGANKVLFTDYFFANESGVVKFTMDVKEANEQSIKYNTFNTDIAVKRNYLTTISGNILTDGNKIKVDIEDAFENVDNDGNTTNPDYDYETISSAAELLAAIKANSGEYIVTANLDVNEVTASTQAATRTTGTGTTINLNGYTITLKTDITIAKDKALTITDINENGETGAIINAGGKIVNNGILNIEGGNFGENTIKNNETEGGKVNITGGTFESDPSDLVKDDDYKVVKNEDNNFEIVIKDESVQIGNVKYRSIQKAFDAADGETTIELIADFTLEKSTVIAEGKNITLKLNGKTITGTSAKDAGAIIENNGTLTIVGGTIKNTYTNGDAVINNTGELVLNGVKINGAPIGETGYPNYAVYTSGTLVVENETEIISDRGVINLKDGADVTINGGNFAVTDAVGTRTLTAHAIYAYGYSSKLTINGGHFKMNIANGGGTSVICPAGATIKVYGGDFYHVPVDDVQSGCFQNYMGYGAPVDVYRGTFNDDTVTKSGNIAEGSEATEANGIWTVRIIPVAKIGETEYETFEAAVAAAKAGDTITLVEDVTLAEELKIRANVTINGNGKQINGTIYAGSNLTFAGHTKVTAFSASYYDRVITIGEGACLEITGGGRVSLAYGNTFNITGSIENAKTADKTNIQPSLIIPAGISITGGSNATMNVTNAYVSFGNTSSKNDSANGTFNLNFTNSIVDFTNQFTFSEPTSGKNPTFNVNITNSVVTCTAKMCFAAPGCKVVINNSIMNLKSNFRNSGKLEVMNGSVFTGSTMQFGENGGNDGETIVDNSTFTITASSAGHALDGKNTGSITAKNGATVSVTYYNGITINVDATSTFTGTDVDANKKIYYVSDEMALEPTSPDALGGAVVVSNVWDSITGKGVITFDRDLTTIGDEAFKRENNTTPSNWATSITLPNSVKTIGNYAFAQCYSLESIIIPDGVTSIGQYAFQSCNAVTSVTIGSNVTTIDSGAFYNCYEIAEIICKPTTPPTLADKWVFNGVETNSVNVFVPTAAVNDYKTAWSVFTNIEGREF